MPVCNQTMLMKCEKLQTKKALDITLKGFFDEQIANISNTKLEILPVEIEK